MSFRRTFVAFHIEAGREIRGCMDHLRRSMKDERIRWVDIEHLHITVTFLGDTREHLIPSIGSVLEEYVPRCMAPAVRVKGMGIFRNLGDPRVIWLGLEPVPVLDILKKKIDSGFEKLGLKLEKRAFAPHLTLGRIKDLKDIRMLAGILDEYRDKSFQQDTVNELILYESILGTGGPAYHPLLHVPFKYAGP